MKIAAVLFILSVYYIASTEQAAGPTGVHTYPSRSWEEMQRKAQWGMVEMNGYVMAYPGAEAQFDVPTDPQEIINVQTRSVMKVRTVHSSACSCFFSCWD